MKFREKCRVRNNVYWKHNLLQYCFDYEIQLICPDNKTFMRDALKIMAEKKDRYYGNRIALIQRVIYIAYNIEKVQPKKINEELEQLGAPIRVHNGTESKGDNRNKNFWQILFIEDYLKLISK